MSTGAFEPGGGFQDRLCPAGAFPDGTGGFGEIPPVGGITKEDRPTRQFGGSDGSGVCCTTGVPRRRYITRLAHAVQCVDDFIHVGWRVTASDSKSVGRKRVGHQDTPALDVAGALTVALDVARVPAPAAIVAASSMLATMAAALLSVIADTYGWTRAATLVPFPSADTIAPANRTTDGKVTGRAVAPVLRLTDGNTVVTVSAAGARFTFPDAPAEGKVICTVRTEAAMPRSWRTTGVSTVITIAGVPGAGLAPPAGMHAGNAMLAAGVAGAALAVLEATTTGTGSETLIAGETGAAFRSWRTTGAGRLIPAVSLIERIVVPLPQVTAAADTKPETASVAGLAEALLIAVTAGDGHDVDSASTPDTARVPALGVTPGNDAGIVRPGRCDQGAGTGSNPGDRGGDRQGSGGNRGAGTGRACRERDRDCQSSEGNRGTGTGRACRE